MVAAEPSVGSSGIVDKYGPSTVAPERSRQAAAAPEQSVAPPLAHVPNCVVAKLVLIPQVLKIPSLSMIHSCTAVKMLLTSFVRLEFLASANLVAGSKATKTTTAKMAIIAITTKSSIKVNPFFINPFSL